MPDCTNNLLAWFHFLNIQDWFKVPQDRRLFQNEGSHRHDRGGSAGGRKNAVLQLLQITNQRS